MKYRIVITSVQRGITGTKWGYQAVSRQPWEGASRSSLSSETGIPAIPASAPERARGELTRASQLRLTVGLLTKLG